MSAQRRLDTISRHVFAVPDDNNDVVIVSVVRSAIGKAGRGSFKDTHPTDILAAVLKEACERINLPKDKVEDICVGNVSMEGAMALGSRQAVFMAGFPNSTSTQAVNRQCSSGLQAVMHIAAQISTGVIDIGIGAGVESMSVVPMGSKVPPLSPNLKQSPEAYLTLMGMGHTSDWLAEKFNISREEQDQFAVESYRRALKAQAEGKFDKEIVPITTTVKETKNGEETVKTITVSKDEGPRPTTIEQLRKLKPAFVGGNPFKCEARATAGNSSQTSDGAAAVVLMRRSTARSLGLPVRGVIRGFAVTGCPPEIMGAGPAYAIPIALQKAGVTTDQIDVFEINEAFASQCWYSAKTLGIPHEKLNPNGGGIALGHPLGCTGSRQIVTLVHELERRGGGKGVVSMCIGTGMGAAAVIEVPKPGSK